MLPFSHNPLSLFLLLCSCIPSYPFYLPSLCFALTFSTGPHMAQCWSFFFIRASTKSTSRPDTVWQCLPVPQFVFRWGAEKTWWPFAQHMHHSLFYCFNYSASQQVHHFYSVFHSLPISDWPFEPSMGPNAIVKPSFGRVLQPHWGLPSPCTAPL